MKSGGVSAFVAVDGVGDGESEVLVFHVGDDLGHGFQGLRHFLFP